MPRHLVQDDLDAGRLVALRIPRWDGGEENPRLAALAAHLARAAPGPAARWMLQRLAVPPESAEQPGC
jgi:hypothetical protein